MWTTVTNLTYWHIYVMLCFTFIVLFALYISFLIQKKLNDVNALLNATEIVLILT